MLAPSAHGKLHKLLWRAQRGRLIGTPTQGLQKRRARNCWPQRGAIAGSAFVGCESPARRWRKRCVQRRIVVVNGQDGRPSDIPRPNLPVPERLA